MNAAAQLMMNKSFAVGTTMEEGGLRQNAGCLKWASELAGRLGTSGSFGKVRIWNAATWDVPCPQLRVPGLVEVPLTPACRTVMKWGCGSAG